MYENDQCLVIDQWTVVRPFVWQSNTVHSMNVMSK